MISIDLGILKFVIFDFPLKTSFKTSDEIILVSLWISKIPSLLSTLRNSNHLICYTYIFAILSIDMKFLYKLFLVF